MIGRKRVFKDFMIYSAGNYISQGLGMINGFLLRIFLDPALMGIWQGLNIIKSYTSYTNLGVTKAAAREIAYYRGKGDTTSQKQATDVAFTFSFLTILLVALMVMASAFFSRGTMSPYIFWGMMAIGIIVVLERIESLIVTMLRANTKFDVEAISKIVSSAANVVLVLVFVRIFSLYGLYSVNIAVFSISIVILLVLSKMRFSFSLDRRELKRLIVIGVPLVLLGFMFTNLTNVDRIVVLKMLGLEQMGLYSVALMMGNIVYNISNMAGIVLYPRFQEIYGKTGQREDVFKTMIKVLKVLSLPLFIFTAAAVMLLPYAVNIIIPKYAEGIPAMSIFLWGTYFLSMSIFCGHYLVTLDKQKYSLAVSVAVIALNLALNISFVKMGYGINGVAFATALSYVTYFVLLLAMAFFVRRRMDMKERAGWKV